MKRVKKNSNSPIILECLEYPKDSKKIREILEVEQSNFCAYTEHRISSAFAVDIEHFNPTRKSILNDYYNWYAVGRKWNSKKASKWADFQPVLQPSDSTLENRINYNVETGTYQADATDTEAQNLLKLLDINNYELSQERRDHIQNIKTLIKLSGIKLIELIEFYKDSKQIQFRRAIETAFMIEL